MNGNCEELNEKWQLNVWNKIRGYCDEIDKWFIYYLLDELVIIPQLILILITAVLYSTPSRKSTQEHSQANLGQTMWS